jgi:hypothetical protein
LHQVREAVEHGRALGGDFGQDRGGGGAVQPAGPAPQSAAALKAANKRAAEVQQKLEAVARYCRPGSDVPTFGGKLGEEAAAAAALHYRAMAGKGVSAGARTFPPSEGNISLTMRGVARGLRERIKVRAYYQISFRGKNVNAIVAALFFYALLEMGSTSAQRPYKDITVATNGMLSSGRFRPVCRSVKIWSVKSVRPASESVNSVRLTTGEGVRAP